VKRGRGGNIVTWQGEPIPPIPALKCKKDCIQDGAHRVPIDCATVADLWRSIDTLKEEKEKLLRKTQKLALRLIDLETRELDD